MSKPKGPDFFGENEIYQKGLKYYNKFFTHCNEENIIGEISPEYMYRKKTPKRIYNTFPEVKLLFILRDPVDRVYSQYWHEVRIGWEKEDFKSLSEYYLEK